MDELQGKAWDWRPAPFDQEEALERAGGELSLLAELAQMCLADAPASLDDIRAALAQGDAGALQRAAHKLKGALLVLSAKPASDAAYRIEILGAEGALDGAAAAIAALEAEVDRLRPALERLTELDEGE